MLALGEPRQPRLHAVEREPLGESLPLLPPPGLAGHEPRGARPHLFGRQQLPARVELHQLDVARRALVGDRELGEAVDVVAPEVDSHGRVGRRREDVDDRPPQRHLAPVLHLVLAPVAGAGQAADQAGGVEPVAGPDRHRLHVLHVTTETLHQRTHRRHEHVGHALEIAQPRHHP